uniref:Single domain-containing protein n=1 Tax=Strigamia maritima TaxID=126957 RepID=T1J633_STRMM
MKLILLVVAFCILQCHSVSGSVGRRLVEPEDGKCVTSNGEVIAPGEDWIDNENCKRLHCSDPERSDGKFQISYAGCGVVGLSAKQKEHCHLERGNGPYPDCCEKHIHNQLLIDIKKCRKTR